MELSLSDTWYCRTSLQLWVPQFFPRRWWTAPETRLSGTSCNWLFAQCPDVTAHGFHQGIRSSQGKQLQWNLITVALSQAQTVPILPQPMMSIQIHQYKLKSLVYTVEYCSHSRQCTWSLNLRTNLMCLQSRLEEDHGFLCKITITVVTSPEIEA